MNKICPACGQQTLINYQNAFHAMLSIAPYTALKTFLRKEANVLGVAEFVDKELRYREKEGEILEN